MSFSASYDFVGGVAGGSVIDHEHFGTNYLFHHDRVDADSTFKTVIDTVGVEFIRYPGGTITEEYFDIANPTADVQQSTFGRNDRGVTPIDDFLNYVQSAELSAVIVIPTYRYFDVDTRAIDPAAEAVIKNFVRELKSGTYGDAEIKGIEIGNEWYQGQFEWTAAEFGALQSQISSWIDEVLHEQPGWTETKVYIQAGRGDDDNNGIDDNFEIAQQFDAAEMDTVDGVIKHFYAATSSGNPLVLGGGVSSRLRDLEDNWDINGENGLDIVVTEWNVGGDGPDNTSVTGLMRNVALLNVFSNMVEEGVDVSAIWTAQAPGPAGLSKIEGDASLTSTGHLYQMMRHALVGTQAIDTQQSDGIYGQDGTQIGRTYVFQGEGKTVVYLASAVDQPIEIDTNMSAYLFDGAHVNATVLGAAQGYEATDYRVEAQTTSVDTSALDSSGEFTFNLNSYEVIQIIISDTPPETPIEAGLPPEGTHHDGTDVADQIVGGGGDDTLMGLAGDDTLEGGAGNDTIEGGVGNDVLRGGDGHDTILGASGKDSIEAGDGDDFVDGGHWHDTIDGGDGNDQLFGGAGKDQIKGGSGDDILDGGKWHDTLEGNDGNDQLFGGKGNDQIKGGEGNDTLAGGLGRDQLFGGNGDDTFVFATGTHTDKVFDFDAAHDLLDVSAFETSFADLDMVETNSGVTVEIDGDDVFEVIGATAGMLTEDLFIL